MYAANDVGSRRQLWEDLLCSQPSLPWIVTGDFNCVRSRSEKVGSDLLNPMAMSDFNEFINSASLLEMPTLDLISHGVIRINRGPYYVDWTALSFP